MPNLLRLLPLTLLAAIGCAEPRCGDGILDAGLGEACDDGNELSGDGCDQNCTISACGNGVAAPGELCFAAPQTLFTAGATFSDAEVTELDGAPGPDLLLIQQRAGEEDISAFFN